MANITLVLEGEKPPSWQDYYAGKVQHWARTKMKDAAHQVVTDAVNRYEEAHGPIAVAFPVRLAYTVFYRTAQRRDLSNIMLKCYEDGIVALGILPDDSTKYVAEMTVRARLDRERPRVEICIEEI